MFRKKPKVEIHKNNLISVHSLPRTYRAKVICSLSGEVFVVKEQSMVDKPTFKRRSPNDNLYQKYIEDESWKCSEGGSHSWMIEKMFGVCQGCGEGRQFWNKDVTSFNQVNLPVVPVAK